MTIPLHPTLLAARGARNLLLISLLLLVFSAAAVRSALAGKGLIDQIPASEYQALVDFYKATDGDHWLVKLRGWNDPNASEWEGITVVYVSYDNQGNILRRGYVDTIQLAGTGLNGTIGPLAGLTQLRVLYLENNYLNGTLEPLAGLTQLEILSSDHNQFTGTLQPLAGLPRLGFIILSDNQFSGTLQPLAGLTQLSYLWLDYNQFSGDAGALLGLNSLAYVKLANNYFDDSPGSAFLSVMDGLKQRMPPANHLPLSLFYEPQAQPSGPPVGGPPAGGPVVTLNGLELAPAQVDLKVGDRVQFTITEVFSDGTRQPLVVTKDTPVRFVTSNAAVLSALADVSAVGLTAGQAEVTASFNGFSAQALVKVFAPAPTVSVAATVPEARADGSEVGVITLTRTGDLSRDLVVAYKVSGSAVGGDDYATLPGTKKIKAGQATATIKVHALGGAANSTVKLTVLAADGYLLGAPIKAKVKIIAAGQ